MNNLDDILFDNNLKEKMHKEIVEKSKEIKHIDTKKKKNIKDLSPEEIFSANTIWKIYNRKTNIHSFINGIQAEGYIGMQDEIRHLIISYQSDCFLVDDFFIEFYSG